MKAILPILFLVSLLLSSCREGGRISREEERIRREVDQRVETIRGEMKVSENRWHTVRIVSFCLLAGGSLIWLCQGSAAPGRAMNPPSYGRNNLEHLNRRRVIDRPYEDDDEPGEYPYRR